jgi:hypothetical protein
MRTRMLRPGFFVNEPLAACTPHARILFTGLWCLADKEGRLEDQPGTIRGRVFPFEGALNVDELLHELASAAFIVRYRVRNVRVIQVCKFREHQQPHKREAESTLPPAPIRASKARPSPEKARPRPNLGTAQPGKGTAQPGVFVPVPVPVLVPKPTPRAPAPVTAPPANPVCADSPKPKSEPKPEVSLEGVVCIALKSAGIAAVNPSHPTLQALVQAGATVGEFADAAKAATGKRDPFAYVLGVVEGRRAQALTVAKSLHAPPPDPNAWQDTHDGVINRGANLGMQWDHGITEDWHAFKRRVIAAHNAKVSH